MDIQFLNIRKATNMIYKPEGTAFQRKMKEENLCQHDHQGLTIRHWLIGHNQDYLKVVNDMDGEKLFSVVQGDRRRSDRNESQNTDD